MVCSTARRTSRSGDDGRAVGHEPFDEVDGMRHRWLRLDLPREGGGGRREARIAERPPESLGDHVGRELGGVSDREEHLGGLVGRARDANAGLLAQYGVQWLVR
jgi:hypothetical protein